MNLIIQNQDLELFKYLFFFKYLNIMNDKLLHAIILKYYTLDENNKIFELYTTSNNTNTNIKFKRAIKKLKFINKLKNKDKSNDYIIENLNYNNIIPIELKNKLLLEYSSNLLKLFDFKYIKTKPKYYTLYTDNDDKIHIFNFITHNNDMIIIIDSKVKYKNSKKVLFNDIIQNHGFNENYNLNEYSPYVKKYYIKQYNIIKMYLFTIISSFISNFKIYNKQIFIPNIIFCAYNTNCILTQITSIGMFSLFSNMINIYNYLYEFIFNDDYNDIIDNLYKNSIKYNIINSEKEIKKTSILDKIFGKNNIKPIDYFIDLYS